MTRKLFLVALLLISFKALASVPILTNFRIENSNPNRVYFDSSEPITGSTYSGFIISGKAISGVNINYDQTSGHYFTVSSAFTFWDNNTIRYEGNAKSNKSNIVGAEGNGVYDFTLTYITNNIPESISSSDRYVSSNAAGGGNGLSEFSPWTWAEAVKNAVSGQTVWIKAGHYNLAPAEYAIRNSGTVSSPIKFIGYRNTIGDISSNYYKFNDGSVSPKLDSSEMPTFDGNSKDKVYPIVATDKNYIIVRNIQISEVQFPIRVSSGLGWLVENCNILEPNDASGAGTGFHFYAKVFNAGIPELTSYRFKNVTVVNSEMSNIFIEGRGNLIDNATAYSDTQNGSVDQSDYLILLQGSDNIIRNSFASTLDASGSLVHGIGIKGYESMSSGSTGKVTNYNLIENCVYTGSGEGYYVRNEAHYNVIKNSTADGGYEGISIRTGASYNVFENLKITNQTIGVGGRHNREIGSAVNITTQGNIIRNCTFDNIKYMASFHMSSFINGTSNKVSLLNNKFQNCTFRNVEYMYRSENQSHPWILSGNTIRNSIFINVRNENYGSRTPTLQSVFKVFDYNNYWNSFTTNLGTNSSSVDPKLDANLRLTLATPSIIYDGGIDIPGLNQDADGVERQSGKYSKGAYDDATPTVGSVGPNPTICIGETTTLVASGGTSYEWNTGETTASINANPIATTTYTVTVSDGTNSDTHNIVVTVNELPTVDLGDDITICQGEKITLTAVGIGDFLWSTGETSESIEVSPTDTTTYSVTANNACNTEVTDEIVVTVNETPVVDLGDDITICLGESITLTASGNGPFEWSTGETTQTINITPNTTTTYMVSSTNGTCSMSDEVVVNVNPAPTVDLGDDLTICQGENITLTAIGIGEFLWSTGETGSSIEVNPNATTTYTVTASNTCSADATDEIVVTVNETPSVDLGNDLTICQGETITLTAIGSGPFQWSTGETTSSIDVNPASTTSYMVTSSNGSCTDTDEIEVTVNELPSVDLGEDIAICEGEKITLTAVGNGPFEWSTGETATSIEVTPISTTTYTVIARNSCASEATDEITVTVNPNVTLNAGSDVSVCQGEKITLVATGSGPFEWSTGETTASIEVTPMSTTTYTVTSSNGSCSKTDQVKVTVNTPPTVNVGSDVSICEGQQIKLTATGSGNFLWSTGETGNSISVSPSSTSIYTVIASSEGCVSTATDNITVSVSEKPSVIASDDVTIEMGTSVTLTATGVGSFLWSTGQTGNSITVSPNVTTSYTVKATTAGGCSQSDKVTVTVVDSSGSGVVNAYAGEDVSICSGKTIVLTASGGDSYLWSTGETNRSITVKPEETIIYSVKVSTGANSATDHITVFIDEKCGISLDKEVVVYPNPTKGYSLLNIEMKGFNGESNISLFNLKGVMVYTDNINNDQDISSFKKQVNLSRFSNGIYLVRVNNYGSTITRKVIVNN